LNHIDLDFGNGVVVSEVVSEVVVSVVVGNGVDDLGGSGIGHACSLSIYLVGPLGFCTSCSCFVEEVVVDICSLLPLGCRACLVDVAFESSYEVVVEGTIDLDY
jgi:hypothetical protein